MPLAHSILKALSFTVGICLGISGCSDAPVVANSASASARIVAPEEVPLPPRQLEPWAPPETTIPAEVVRLVELLYSLGMADPRGCSYHEVEIALDPKKIHGWVLPTGSHGQQYVIGYDGLVHPALSVGDEADLRADVSAALARKIVEAPRDPL